MINLTIKIWHTTAIYGKDKKKTGPAQFGTTPTPKTPEDAYDTYFGKDDDFNFDGEPYQYDPLYKPSELPPGTPVSSNYLPSPPIGIPPTPPLGPVSPAGPQDFRNTMPPVHLIICPLHHQYPCST